MSTHILHSDPSGLRHDRAAAIDPGFLVAAALFAAVLIAEAAFIALAAPALTDIGSLYITAT